MAFRRFWCKMIARKRVCDYVEETPKDKLASKPVLTFTSKNYDEKSTPYVTKPMTINSLASADTCATITPVQIRTSLHSDPSADSIDVDASRKLIGQAPATACVIPNNNSPVASAPVDLPPCESNMNSINASVVKASSSKCATPVAPLTVSNPNVSSTNLANSIASAPVSPAKARESISSFNPARAMSKSSETIKPSKRKNSFRKTKELFSKISKPSSYKQSNSSSDSSQNKLKPKAWATVSKPEIIPVSIPLPIPKPVPGQSQPSPKKKRTGKSDPMAYLNKTSSTKLGRKLFTPGPLMVSDRVKSAMQIEVSARHSEFSYITEFVRSSLLQIARVDKEDYTAIPIGGSGTFVIESALKTLIGTQKRTVLIMSNGTNGDRIAKLCKASKIKNIVIPVDKKSLEETLKKNQDIAGVLVVHCEASTGLINPVKEIGEIVKQSSKDKMFFVDAMTSFGSVPLDMKNVDFVVSNSCRSLHSVPGIAFVIAKRATLEKMRLCDIDRAMDIGAYLEDLDAKEKNHFSPPTQVMLAFKEALIEYSDQGSLKGRAEQYKKNNAILRKEMESMGFKPLFKECENPDGYLLTVFQYPKDPLFVYEEFFQRLADIGCLLSTEDKSLKKHFRIANMGHMNENDIRDLSMKIKRVLEDMRMEVPFEDPVF